MHKESAEHIRHRQEAEKRLSKEGKRYFNLIEFDPNEQLILEIRKHPFGLFLIFLTGGFIITALVASVMYIFSGNAETVLGTDGFNNLSPIVSLLLFFLTLATAGATLLAAFLYKSNVIYVTSEKMAQVLYLSLFNRKISQLSIGDVQDVTVSQKGIFATFLNYGTLVVETAGEQQNYTFTFVPDPYQTSKAIVSAHEENLKAFGN